MTDEAVLAEQETRTGAERFRHFQFVLFGQVLSIFGSALTAFSLGVWAFQEAESVSAYTSIFFATAFGTVIALPIAGSLVDRWQKKPILIISSLASALISLIIALLYFSNMLEVWLIVICAGINGMAMAFSRPAITASIKLLIDPDDLGKANGLAASGYGLTALVAPVSAGYLLVKLDLIGILIIDLCTFMIGIVVLSFLKLPKRQLAPEESIIKSIVFAWRYLKERNALLWLIAFYFILNLFAAAIVVLIQPLVLTITDASGLGLVLSIGGVGYLFGAILMGVFGGPKRKIIAIYASALLMGLGMSLLPLSTNLAYLAAGAFLLAMALPISMASNQSIIQKKVDSQYIGRVDGMGMLLIKIATPLGYLAAGPLAELVFEPYMAVEHSSNALLASIYGTGQGRGIALMVSFISIILVIVVLLAVCAPKIRRIELDLEDRE